MGDLDSIYLQGLAYLHSSDPASTKKLVNLCEELIASSEWAGVTISESGDLSSLVNTMYAVNCNISIKVLKTAVKFSVIHSIIQVKCFFLYRGQPFFDRNSFKLCYSTINLDLQSAVVGT